MKSGHLIAAAALLAALLIPAPARAFSVDDVIQMHLDQFADSLIVMKIRNSGSVFHLEVRDLHKLKEAGVSDDVVAAMLNTERPGEVQALTGQGTALQSPPATTPRQSQTVDSTAQGSDPITTGAPFYVPRPHHYMGVYAPYHYSYYPYYAVPYYPGISFALSFGFYGHSYPYYPYRPYWPVRVYPRPLGYAGFGRRY